MLFFLGIAFLAHSSFGQNVLLPEQPIPAYTFKNLKDSLDQARPQTIEAALSLLPETLRGNSTFLKESDSLQGASPENPRVILWNEQGNLALSFNGLSSQRGGTAIETMRYDPSERKFHFYEIAIPYRGIEEPTKCLQCHGKDPRPIWEEYPLWKKTFGAYDDTLPDSDLAELNLFKTNATQNPRFVPTLFSWLTAEGTDHFPYRPNSIVKATNLYSALTFRPNQRLGAFFNRINAHRLKRKIDDLKLTEAQQNEVYGTILGCNGFEESARDVEVLAAYGLKPEDFDLRYHYDDPSNQTLDFRLSYFDGAASAIEYLAGQIFKDQVSVRGLMDKYRDSSARNQLDWPLLKMLDQISPWLPLPYRRSQFTQKLQKREPFVAGYGDQWRAACQVLHLSANTELYHDIEPKLVPASKPAGLMVIEKRCIECHSNGFKVPFDDPTELKKLFSGPTQELWIKKVTARTNPDANENFRMPFLGKALQEPERTALLDYLKSLGSEPPK